MLNSTDHFYPALQWLLEKDNGYLSYYSKSFYVGEFDWTGLHGGANLDTFYSTIEKMEGSGSMMWSLFGHGKSISLFSSLLPREG